MLYKKGDLVKITWNNSRIIEKLGIVKDCRFKYKTRKRENIFQIEVYFGSDPNYSDRGHEESIIANYEVVK